MLGIIIGVGAVIAMLAVGTGASRKIAQQVASVGSNLIIVVPGSITQGGMRMGHGAQSTLTTGDAQAIEAECPAVAAVAPILNGSGQVVFGNQNWATAITGTTGSILDVRDCSLVSGRNFSDQDVRNATKVCIIGQTLVENLFGSEEPVGRIIRIKGVPFNVIGVRRKRGSPWEVRTRTTLSTSPSPRHRRRSSAPPFPAWSAPSWSRPGAPTSCPWPRPR
jgi:putative ABC transport system permease protein